MKLNKQPILLIRISKKEYNKTLLEDFKVYMNPQLGFSEKKDLTSGQFDPNEGLVFSNPFRLKYSTDQINWTTLINEKDSVSLKRDSHAYIFCMYAVQFDPTNYNSSAKTYTQIIPWKYIKGFFKEGEASGLEMLIFLDSVAFINILCDASVKAGLSCCGQLISYDLEEKLADPSYFNDVKNNIFTSVFHKKEKDYSIQNEYRFSVICHEKPNHLELPIEHLEKAKIQVMDIFENQDIILTFHNVKLQDNGHFKSFSGIKINFVNVSAQ